MRAAGFVLAGGRSSRMGQDKALLQGHSGPLVLEVARQVQVAAGNVALIGDPKRYQNLGHECLADLRPGLGPLAGIETALCSGRGEANLIVACDMPDVQISWLEALIAVAAESGALCTALRDTGGTVQPLCAVYRTECLPVVQRALDDRRLKLLDLLPTLGLCTVPIDGRVFNVNTPEEWTAWRDVRVS